MRDIISIFINKLVKEFNDSQDDIQVVAEFQGEYDDAINKLKSSALSHSGPDIMQVYEIGTKWMMDSESLNSLTNLLIASPPFPPIECQKVISVPDAWLPPLHPVNRVIPKIPATANTFFFIFIPPFLSLH